MTSSYEAFSIPPPGGVDSTNALEKLTEQLAAVADLNRVLTATALPSATLIEKLKEWLEDLTENLRIIVESLAEVASYAISVGAPAGVSVTVTFASDR